jgi:integrase
MAKIAAQVEGVYERVPGSGLWHARYRQDGKLVRKSFGKNRAAAIAYVEKARTLKRSGEGFVPSTAKSSTKTKIELEQTVSTVTVAELCDDLLRHIQNKPDFYKDQRNPPFRLNLIKKTFGHRPASTVRPFEIMDWLESMDKAPATLNRYKATFSAVYRYGKQRDKVQSNPVRDVSQHRLKNGVIRYLLPEEEQRLRAVLQGAVDECGPQNDRRKKRLQHRIYELDIALGTGMRKGEQYGLRWRDIDFRQKLIVLRDTKNKSSRTVPMIDDVVYAFTELRKLSLERKDRAVDQPNSAPEDVVFGIGDNKKWWESALKEAKIKNLRWHDLRHTFCSRLAQAGVSLKVIQEAAGHKTISMSARYAQMDQTTLLNAMAILNRN